MAVPYLKIKINKKMGTRTKGGKMGTT